jgi:hypothetical protein
MEREVGEEKIEQDGWERTLIEGGVHYEDAGGETMDVYASELGEPLDIPNEGREE